MCEPFDAGVHAAGAAARTATARSHRRRARRAPRQPAAAPACWTSQPGLRDLLADASRYRFQVVLGLVEERLGEKPVLVQHGFRAGAEYLYPASTVKLFARGRRPRAARRAAPPRRWPRHRRRHAARLPPPLRGEELEDADPTNLDGGTSPCAHEIRKLFLVSDNEAFNRLYEFVGPTAWRRSLERAGHRRACASSTGCRSRARRRRTCARRGSTSSRDGFRTRCPSAPPQPLPAPPPMPGLLHRRRLPRRRRTTHRGADGLRRQEPRRRSPTSSAGSARWCAPTSTAAAAGFTLTEADRELLLRAMSQLPRESANPRLRPGRVPRRLRQVPPARLERVIPAERLRVYNKIGQAYGFTLDNAWIDDRQTGRALLPRRGDLHQRRRRAQRRPLRLRAGGAARARRRRRSGGARRHRGGRVAAGAVRA